jgi:hypothetical protein
MYLDIEADEGDDNDDNDEEDEDEDGDDNEQDQRGYPARSPKVMSIPGPSAKDILSQKFDEIYNSATKVSGSDSSRSLISHRASQSPATLEPQSRMYLLHVHSSSIISLRTATSTTLLITS